MSSGVMPMSQTCETWLLYCKHVCSLRQRFGVSFGRVKVTQLLPSGFFKGGRGSCCPVRFLDATKSQLQWSLLPIPFPPKRASLYTSFESTFFKRECPQTLSIDLMKPFSRGNAYKYSKWIDSNTDGRGPGNQ
jgi:hypothetical protein